MKTGNLIVVSVAAALLGVSSAAVMAKGGSGKGGAGLPDPNYDFRTPSAEKVDLGRNLYFDKILSGNQNMSCATCHHSLTDTGDGLSLPVGEGGVGLGITRNVGSGADLIHERVPRNAPPVFNLGDRQFHTLFHDGRVTSNPSEATGFPSGCKTPAGHDLPNNLENVLACQAMFPVTSATEMAGQAGENSIADAADAGNLAGPGGVWEQLAQRLQGIPEYVDMFIASFPGDVNSAGDITYAHAANAISAFEGVGWRFDNSAFDRHLRGENGAMSGNAKKGMRLFYKGRGNGTSCADCHSGLYQTDHAFHAIAMPQIGSGRGSNSPGQSGGHEDFGREQVTGDLADILKFRTPSLRNIGLTVPYGHSGAYNSLRAVVEHHINAVDALNDYNNHRQAILPAHPTLDAENYSAMDDPSIITFIADHNELAPMNYRTKDVDHIMDFLHALTDSAANDLRSDIDVVNGVPSGLPVVE